MNGMPREIAGSSLPVTVIVPAYNASATLQRAISSVLAQSLQPAEIIIVDDASTDDTWTDMERLRSTVAGPKLVTIRLAGNVGAADARNAAWDVATQEYVAFLDADDFWHPRKLEVQYGWMSDHADVALCGHRCEVMDGELEVFPPIAETPVRYFGLSSFLVANRLSTPTVMLKRAVGFRFAKGKRYAEDYLLWMSIVSAYGPAAFIDLPLAFLFKAKYGAAGLSSHVWPSHIGVLDTMSRLREDHIISGPVWLLAMAWSWIKFARRRLALMLARR